MQKYIKIKGARENNLKNIDLVIPKDKLIVMTGVSGSGKTTLAFDTIYAEGQRRYVESLSSYARQFLGILKKPDVDSIEGLSPAISIDQKTTNRNPRSTVGTVTEIYDYLRLLYARIGDVYCPIHNIKIAAKTITEMTGEIMSCAKEKIVVLARLVYLKKGDHAELINLLKQKGYARIRLDGCILDLDSLFSVDPDKKHTIEVVVDRIKAREGIASRLYDSLEVALKLTGGKVNVLIDDTDYLFTEILACPVCDFTLPKLTPSFFSFNSPLGACPVCKGLGFLKQISLELLIPNPELSIRSGAIRYFKNIVDTENIEWQTFKVLLDYYHISIDVPYRELSDFAKEIILYGAKEPITYTISSRGMNTIKKTKAIEGIASLIERRYKETTSQFAREYYNSYLDNIECPACHGKKLSSGALAVKIGGMNISEVSDMTIDALYDFIANLNLDPAKEVIADLILKELKTRLRFLRDVGLDYLTLSRFAGSLSGGESQRIRLATQIGSNLTGVLYVLDEPSIGLHQRDNQRLIAVLKKMRDLGNTLIVVEHDEEIIRQGDYIVDIGPLAGIYGGEVVAAGSLSDIMNCEGSLTGNYLSKKKFIPVPSVRRKGTGCMLVVVGAAEHNLKHIDAAFPLGTFIVVTGVSGSGKSTLVNETLVKNLKKKLFGSRLTPGRCDYISGTENVEKIVEISQAPIGRTPRSNPATYTGVFDYIRDLFAETKTAKERGYDKGRFSFNVKGGRCEKCCGDGVLRIEMHFLPDVYVPCAECGGKRYNKETLDVKFKGKNIAEVLDMTIAEAGQFFAPFPLIKAKLDTLNAVGLGYVKLGQSSTTLSGGEAQRVKLATELAKKVTAKTIYVLDEPTTGLHSEDVKKLLQVLNQMVDAGATVIVIEHNLDVIKQADYIIDLGPEGGDKGGEIVASGTPEEVAKCKESYTGIYLKKVLAKESF